MKLDGGRGHEGCFSTGEFHFVTQSAAHHMRAFRGLERRVKIEAGVDGRRRATWSSARVSSHTTLGFIFASCGSHAEILEKPGRPLPLPTYLPTYLPYLWETKKETMGRVKVGYYTN